MSYNVHKTTGVKLFLFWTYAIALQNSYTKTLKYINNVDKFINW